MKEQQRRSQWTKHQSNLRFTEMSAPHWRSCCPMWKKQLKVFQLSYRSSSNNKCHCLVRHVKHTSNQHAENKNLFVFLCSKKCSCHRLLSMSSLDCENEIKVKEKDNTDNVGQCKDCRTKKKTKLKWERTKEYECPICLEVLSKRCFYIWSIHMLCEWHFHHHCAKDMWIKQNNIFLLYLK